MNIRSICRADKENFLAIIITIWFLVIKVMPDSINRFFNYEFWGDKFDRRYLFNFILPEYVEEALDLQARTLPQAELKAKEASREIARKFVEGSASNQVF